MLGANPVVSTRFRSRCAEGIIISLLLLLALALRVWRLDGSYEQFDEKIAVEMSRHLARVPGWDDNWKTSVPGFSYADQYNFSAYLYATHIFHRGVTAVSGAGWVQARDGLFVHRLFSALCATAAVGLLVFTGRRIGGTMLGLSAGLLAAVNPQLVQDAHYARPEAFMTLLTVAGVCLGLSAPARGRLVWLGLLVGVLAATKLSNAMLLMMPAGIVWIIAVEKAAHWWRPDWRIMTEWGGAVLLGFIAGWIAGVPYALVHWDQYWSGLHLLAGQYAGSHPPHSFPDYRKVWTIMGNYYLATQGWPLILAAGGGLAISLWRREGRVWFLLGLPLLASVLLFGSQRVFFERNLSMVLPGALLLAGWGLIGAICFLLDDGWLQSMAVAAALLLAGLTGDRAVRLFLSAESMEKETAWQDMFVQGLERDFPGIRLAKGSLFGEQEFAWLRGELVAGRGELLYVVIDFNDAYKPRYLPELEQQFRVVPVAEYRGAFADYPPSAFTVFHGPRLRAYFLRNR